jgi:chromatin modification-related protein EAF6
MEEDELYDKKRELEEDMKKIDSQIYKLETSYLLETQLTGNVVKGFDGFISLRSRVSGVGQKRIKFKDSDRWFSNSSSTAKISLEERVMEDEIIYEESTPVPDKSSEKKKRKDTNTSEKKKKKKKKSSDSE